ncbi:hypothetical protein CR513_05836, partial [Mucuna pruriens]
MPKTGEANSPLEESERRGGNGPPGEQTPQCKGTLRLKGVINTIVKGFVRDSSSSTKRRYLRTINSIHTDTNRVPQQLPPITFTDHDFVRSNLKQNDPMVTTIEVANFAIKKILINQGSSTDILYMSTFKRFGGRHILQHSDQAPDIEYPMSHSIDPTPGHKFPSSDGQVVIVKANQKIDRQCYVDSLQVVTRPSKEDNISVHVEISTNVELDPNPLID